MEELAIIIIDRSLRPQYRKKMRLEGGSSCDQRKSGQTEGKIVGTRRNGQVAELICI